MAKHLIVDFNLFDANQNIYLIEEDGSIQPISSKPTDLIPETLSYLLDKYDDVEGVDLQGYESYLKEFGSQVLNEIIRRYSNRNVRIYINGKIFN